MLLGFHQAIIARLLDLGRDGVTERLAGRAWLEGKLERAQAVEAHFIHKVQQRLKLFFGLTRVAHNEGGTQGQLGHRGAHFIQGAMHPVHVCGAAHAPQHRRVSVLQRHIQVGEHLRLAGHDFHQAVGDVTGVGIHDAYPVHMRDGAHQVFQQLRQAIFHPQVVPVIRCILGDKDQLANTHLLQSAGFIQDGTHRAADRGALDQRDGAEGARSPATVSDLDIGAGTLHRSAQRATLIGSHRGCIWQMVNGLGMGTVSQAGHHIHDIHPATCPQDAVNARHLPGNLDAVTLRQASGCNKQLASALVRGQIAQNLQRFLFRRTDKTAGIYNHHFCIGGITLQAVT